MKSRASKTLLGVLLAALAGAGTVAAANAAAPHPFPIRVRQ